MSDDSTDGDGGATDGVPDEHAAYLAENRAHWEEAAEHHLRTEAYDMAGFLDGQSTLTPIESAELPPVAGTDVLHLQCHFGLDTLSLARRGATVTGLDFAETAVTTARELATEAGLADRATFVRANVYDAATAVDGQFDLVFTTYGVLDWLPELGPWARAAADCLRPGGTLYLAEFHPFLAVLPWEFDGGETAFDGPYPHVAAETETPETWDTDGTYADPDLELSATRTHFWRHGVGELVTALADAGLRIEFLHEHARTPWEQFDGMRERDDGLYEFPDDDLPLVVSVRATRPE